MRLCQPDQSGMHCGMNWLHYAIDLFFHLDKHLDQAAASLGTNLYFLLFAIVFCETGWW